MTTEPMPPKASPLPETPRRSSTFSLWRPSLQRTMVFLLD
jgi:hypothetical protein